VRVETIGNATLYLGDCTEIIESLSMAVLISDPPYGIRAKLGMGGGYKGEGGMWKDVTIAGDDSTDLRDYVLAKTAVPFAVFASPRAKLPENVKATVIWDKGEHTGAGDLRLPWKPSFEYVHVGGDGWHSTRRSGGIVRVNAIAGCVGKNNKGHRYHPFEKPVKIMEHFVQRAPAGVICDPFMGSGTTGVACVNLDRPFIGIEVHGEYFDMACKRIEAAYAQGRLFA
jgi:DNA modification methylase